MPCAGARAPHPFHACGLPPTSPGRVGLRKRERGEGGVTGGRSVMRGRRTCAFTQLTEACVGLRWRFCALLLAVGRPLVVVHMLHLHPSGLLAGFLAFNTLPVVAHRRRYGRGSRVCGTGGGVCVVVCRSVGEQQAGLLEVTRQCGWWLMVGGWWLVVDAAN